MKDFKNKYFTASNYNNFTNNILDAKLTTNESGLNEKIKTLATKTELKADRFVDQKTYYSYH